MYDIKKEKKVILINKLLPIVLIFKLCDDLLQLCNQLVTGCFIILFVLNQSKRKPSEIL